MNPNRKSIFLVCGESSGNKHAVDFIREYISTFGDADFTAIGSEEMKSFGVNLLFSYTDINLIGFTSVLKNFKKLKDKLNQAIRFINDTSPDAVILLDSPGFNLRLMQNIRSFYTGKIIYYISPQLWAWHKSRVKIIRDCCDLMLVIFPFEVNFYKREGVKALYTGNPLVIRIDKFLSSYEERPKTKITLLPGSREEEIIKILPVFLKAGMLLAKEFNLQVQIVYPEQINPEIYGNLADVKLIKNTSNELFYTSIADSALVLTKMGTASLECALIGTPFITGYKTNFLNYSIAKFFTDLKYLTMANILIDKPVVKEFIQNDFTVDNIISEGRRILSDEEYNAQMVYGLRKVREILTDKDASSEAARIIHSLLK
ncbi:MAG: Lipid A disaccharide synthetase [Chlorobi bacterium OLB4]|jgi:lipid-A-disaccharide synthase|nr:MAG: Lipid A disaccharide synthetase [Chlorobi bacterium OLB4]MBW7855455.1 lipid-A-disaccharide synthase [Ignavibacteria bacterium]OQY77040.1 MAG: lipid-A-disaccharide synthase [Ignavibacteriales bacterium UTCHB1]